MAIFSEIIISAFLFVVISRATPNSPPTEDLQEEYYTVTPAVTDKFLPQDEKDAQAIIDSNKSPAVIASILPYRGKERRYAINMKMATNSTDKKSPWFGRFHEPEGHPFEDCCFSLIEKETTVLSNYLAYFMRSKMKQRVGFVMILAKETKDLMDLFNSINMAPLFDNYSEELGEPYTSLVRKWAEINRDPLEKDALDQQNVIKDVNVLNTEHNNGGWKTTRSQLESIFLQKSIKYARAVITEFEKLNNGKTIEDIILGYGLDNEIASTYRAFAQYIKYKYTFIAEMLLKYSDGLDQWEVWTMCMAVIHPQEWSKVDEAFKQINKGVPLTTFITERKIDKVMAEMMAVIIDPSFVPTQFKPAKV